MAISRRTLLASAGVVAATLAIGGAADALDGGGECLRPPGAQDEDHFAATCIRCNRCVSICPQSCLETARLEDGLLTYRTPIINFHKGICDFCDKCEMTCPTGSIHDVNEDTSVIGIAEVDKERCIAYQGRGCTICQEACTYEAITLDDAGRPVIDLDKCNGCGRCEYACPSNSYLSYVGGDTRGINVVRKEA